MVALAWCATTTMIGLKMGKSMDHENNEFRNQQVQANLCELLPQTDCESLYHTGRENGKGNETTKQQHRKLMKRKFRKTECDAHAQGVHGHSIYPNNISLEETSNDTPLCATLDIHNTTTNLNETWPRASEIPGCSMCRCCPTCRLHTAANDVPYTEAAIATSSSKFTTCYSSSKLCSKSCRTCLKPATTVLEKSLSSSGNTPGRNTQFTSSESLLYNVWHQLCAMLVWHITASTVISLVGTLCWLLAHTQTVVALSFQTVDGAASGASAGTSAPLDDFYSASASLTTTMTTMGISPLAERMPLPTVTTTPKSHRNNSGRNMKSSSKTKSAKNRFSNNIAPFPNTDTIDANIIDNSRVKTTEIKSPNNISSRHPIEFSSSSTFNSTSASGYDYDISWLSSTPSIANHSDADTLAHNGGFTLDDSLEGNGNKTSGDANDSDDKNDKESFDDISAEDTSEYIFDRTDVRVIFISLYTMVFCCCFFGNLLVILVVTLSRRLRSITNFFLANLALADFCVGLFCVMQNLSIYLIDSWVFGEFLCRMYQFVHSLSYTASIFILVVICMERYFAIVHPITCKQILTAARLRMVILTVWITSAVYSTPKFVFSKTIKNVHTESGREEEICVLDRKMFNSKLLDMINFVLLYMIPLLVMTVLYSKIAIALWRSSRGLTHHLAQQHDNSMGLHNSMYHHHHQQHPNNHLHNNHHHPLHNQHQMQQQTTTSQTQQALSTAISVNSSVGSGGSSSLSRKQSSKYEKRGVSLTESQHDNFQVSMDADCPVVSACRKTSFYQHNHLPHHHIPQTAQATTGNQHHRHNHNTSGGSGGAPHGSQRVSHYSHSSNNVLRARRGVVRMLIIFVLTFALCNLPYHARKMWQYWSRSYRGDSNFNALFTPLTFLVTYFNSGINPLLYAFLSRNFRKGMKELLMCSWRKSKTKSSTNSSMHHKRMTLQTHSLPTDTTHIGNEQL